MLCFGKHTRFYKDFGDVNIMEVIEHQMFPKNVSNQDQLPAML